MTEWYEDRIRSAINGTNPMVMTELAGGYAVFGDVQFLPGYSVLLPKRNVASLNDLAINERTAFLRDMSILGDAVLFACHAKRINYDILGNTDNFLHAHVFPRYLTEDAKKLKKPVWLYSSDYWTNPKYLYDPQKHDQLRQKITDYLISHTNYRC
ncbi:HIT family protein [Liquorilactobacillus ghanensis]|uniref:HIT family protein n=1 Tax=Liquorilactobacillus ghanensis TaxID=399370 RepID=UPI0039EA0F8A